MSVGGLCIEWVLWSRGESVTRGDISRDESRRITADTGGLEEEYPACVDWDDWLPRRRTRSPLRSRKLSWWLELLCEEAESCLLKRCWNHRNSNVNLLNSSYSLWNHLNSWAKFCGLLILYRFFKFVISWLKCPQKKSSNNYKWLYSTDIWIIIISLLSREHWLYSWEQEWNKIPFLTPFFKYRYNWRRFNLFIAMIPN